MKNFIKKIFCVSAQESTEVESEYLRELRVTRHASGVKVYGDLVADVLAAKAEMFNNAIINHPRGHRPRVLSISKTVYP